MGFQVYNSQGQELQNLTGTAGGDLTGTYPNPTVASGAVSLSKIAKVPGAKATRTTNLTYTAGAAIAWSSVTSTYGFDNDSMWSSGSNTRLTVNTAGIYLVQCSVYFNVGSGTTTAIFHDISANGTAITVPQQNSGFGAGASGRSFATAIYAASANDYFTTSFNPSGGSSITLYSDAQTWFSAVCLGRF